MSGHVKGMFRDSTDMGEKLTVERSAVEGALTVALWYGENYKGSVVLSAKSAKAMSKCLMYEALASEGKV